MTTEQAMELAQTVRNIADSLKNFKLEHWQSLSPDQQESINCMQLQLYDYSQEIITQAVDISIDEASGSLEELQQVLANANQAIKELHEVTRVLAIASSIAELCFKIINNLTSYCYHE